MSRMRLIMELEDATQSLEDHIVFLESTVMDLQIELESYKKERASLEMLFDVDLSELSVHDELVIREFFAQLQL